MNPNSESFEFDKDTDMWLIYLYNIIIYKPFVEDKYRHMADNIPKEILATFVAKSIINLKQNELKVIVGRYKDHVSNNSLFKSLGYGSFCKSMKNKRMVATKIDNIEMRAIDKIYFDLKRDIYDYYTAENVYINNYELFLMFKKFNKTNARRIIRLINLSDYSDYSINKFRSMSIDIIMNIKGMGPALSRIFYNFVKQLRFVEGETS